jgi:hypothetical protein
VKINSRAMMAGPFRLAAFGVLAVAAAAVSACSNDGPGVKVRPPQTASFPAAVATGCIAPSGQTQTVPLPSAGGLSGTITVGAFSGSSSSCLAITVATGADATLTGAPASAKRSVLTAASPLPSPLAQIDLNNTVSNVTWLAVTFQLQSPAVVPAGNYPATITTTVDLGDGQVLTTVANYSLAVAANGTASIVGPIAQLNVNTTGLLTIYPVGATLPTPTPSQSPSASPTASASASASPSTTPAPSAAPSATPSATPSPTAMPSTGDDCVPYYFNNPPCGSYVANGYFDGGPNMGQTVLTTPQPIYLGNPTYVDIPGQYFVGTLTITLSTYNPGPQYLNVSVCPSSVPIVQSGTNGEIYTLTFPADLQPQEFSNPSNVNGGTSYCYLGIGPAPNEENKFIDPVYP